MEPLTTKQQAVYDYCREFIEVERYAPSIRELMDKLSITAPNGIVCHLKALKRKGWIDFQPKTARSITLLGPAGPNPEADRYRTALVWVDSRLAEGETADVIRRHIAQVIGG